METYLQVFVNDEKDIWFRLLLIAKFAYNNMKNISTIHTFFELYFSYHSRASYEKYVNSRSQSKSADKIAIEVQKLILVCKNNP